jgi:hypothetical protein
MDRAGDHEKDCTIGHDCVLHVARCTCWLWKGGSTHFLWRWTDEFKISIWDRTLLWMDMGVVLEY